MSLNDQVTASLALAHDELEMPNTVEGLLITLRRILAKPFIQRIVMQTGKPIQVDWFHDISDSLQMVEPEDTPDFVLSRVDLEEFDTAAAGPQCLFDATILANQHGLHITHMLVGKVSIMKDWLGLPRVLVLRKYDGTDYLHVAGIRTLEVPSIPEDAVILLASEVRDANLTEVTRGYRITT
ncbi:MAG: hypothetical protein HN396_17615 [Gemmatimonadales bacterium]|jgi:hypothetical protein|nr:hypothetical protein [Gemmatimonadales bacterium]